MSANEAGRYARQLPLEGIGPAGQERLRRAAVLVVGAGGLGSPVLLYLTAAGVGRIGIVEDDVVELTNLNRQILYTSADVGRPKVEAAVERLAALNPEVALEPHRTRFSDENAARLMREYDLLIDASDNFATRYLANQAAVEAGVPLVHGSIRHYEGRVAVFNYQGGPCYACLFPKPPQAELTTADRAVIGVVPGTVGTLMATEALKLILGVGEPLAGRLLLYDAAEMSFRILNVTKNPNCPVCGG